MNKYEIGSNGVECIQHSVHFGMTEDEEELGYSFIKIDIPMDEEQLPLEFETSVQSESVSKKRESI